MPRSRPLTTPRLFIDLSAIERNFRSVRALVGEAVEVSAVVKSDAYGLGLERVLEPLAAAGCRSFFVATPLEARRVRQCLPRVDIFVLGGYRGERECFRRERIVPVCNTLGEVEAASCAGGAYAINLETGFSRLGLNLSDLRYFLHRLHTPPVLIMSHLACADDPAHSLNRLQRDRFIGMAGLFGGGRRSLAASAGLSLGADYHFDQVRVGSALFGLNNARLDPNPFLPVVRMSAQIADIRFVHAGATIGYMATARVTRPTWVAIIAVGYVHGLAWSLANRMSVEIGSHHGELLGRISMEYAAIDVTDVPASLRRPGLWVDLVNAKHPVEDMANAAGTVSQELLVRAGSSCHRRYRTGHRGMPT